jgi:hypothetical protein
MCRIVRFYRIFVSFRSQDSRAWAISSLQDDDSVIILNFSSLCYDPLGSNSTKKPNTNHYRPCMGRIANL